MKRSMVGCPVGCACAMHAADPIYFPPIQSLLGPNALPALAARRMIFCYYPGKRVGVYRGRHDRSEL